MILGLTGGYCSGKSSVASILVKQGWLNIEMDSLGHRALELGKAEAGKLLGPSVINEDGSPNRRAIAALVFQNPVLLRQYEAIIHPIMNRLCEEAIDEAGKGARIIINAAILYRLPALGLCDLVVEVRASIFIRLFRAWQRDGLKWNAALKRIKSQKELWKPENRRTKPIIINNNFSIACLEKAVKKKMEKITEALCP